ncbi:MAG: lipopolysaccharide kinase InaA family protein [Anaerohalosphaeraceae bacterium]|nr:lipopolysaccharide kinase InaA family protein [Anaerohalosphaeraceae bacterium]
MSELIKISKVFFIDEDYAESLKSVGIVDIDTAFDFSSGQNLHKAGLADYRTRIMFEASQPAKRFFLKRYQNIPKFQQIKNWLAHRSRKSTMSYDVNPAEKLRAMGIDTPKTIACGQQWGRLFENRSFVITEQVQNAESLEKRLPACLTQNGDKAKIDKKKFIDSLAEFARKFHKTGYRHRDFYLCHIFYSNNGKFTLIDLNRLFRPILFGWRYKIKDITQLYYSSPGSVFSRTDKLRFYLRYANIDKLKIRDRIFIKNVKAKAQKMAKHDLKHSRNVPFAS